MWQIDYFFLSCSFFHFDSLCFCFARWWSHLHQPWSVIFCVVLRISQILYQCSLFNQSWDHSFDFPISIYMYVLMRCKSFLRPNSKVRSRCITYNWRNWNAIAAIFRFRFTVLWMCVKRNWFWIFSDRKDSFCCHGKHQLTTNNRLDIVLASIGNNYYIPKSSGLQLI